MTLFDIASVEDTDVILIIRHFMMISFNDVQKCFVLILFYKLQFIIKSSIESVFVKRIILLFLLRYE